MPQRPDTALYFTTVIAVRKDYASIGGHLYFEENDPTITRISVWYRGTWNSMEPDMTDLANAAEMLPPRGQQPASMCFLGRKGVFREIPLGGTSIDTQIDIRGAGYLNDLKYIGAHLYCCGGQRQVHRLDAAGWSRADAGAFVPLGTGRHVSFEAIDGFSETDIYAVGWPRDIWHFDGTAWTQLDSPTGYPLFCVLCSKSGDVYVGGSNGVLFKGDRKRGWTDLSDSGVTTRVIENLAEFQGKVYGAATIMLLSTTGNTLEQVYVPIEGEKAYYAIDANEEEMWVVGDESILQYDGTSWNQHICPENV
jgi:hypothetical protein